MRFRSALGLVLALASLRGDDRQQAEDPVNLNVIAVDSHGQPVTGLTRDDFQVTDAGKPQKIAFFRHNDSKLWPVPQLGPNEFSNRRAASVPCATLILFDLLNERFGTRGAAWSQLVRYFEPLESADYLYLYLLTLDGRLYAVHGLPSAESQDARPGEPPWTRQIKALMNEAMHAVLTLRPVDIDVAIRVQLTYRALDGLAMQLSRVPGRKNIVWITDGVPISLGPIRSDTGDFVDFTPQLRQLSEGLDRSGIAVYPVRQVMIGSPNAMGAGPDAMGANPRGSLSTGNLGGLGSAETLDEFAGMTGGRPDAGKDIGAAVKQAMTDVRTSYQIGYYPASLSRDGKFHKLRVTCTRKKVRIQTKTGYYAWPDPPGMRAREAIEAAISPAFDAAEIGLRASLSPDAKAGHSVRLAAHIDANDIALVQQKDQYTGQLQLAVVSYLADGRTESSSVTALDLHYSAQERDQALKQGIFVAQNVTLGENVKTIRLIVFDCGFNTIGSLSIPVKGATPSSPR